MRIKARLTVILLYIFMIAAAAAMVYFCYCANCSGKGILLSHDLEGKELYIHNETCSEMHMVRPVEDDAIRREIADICTKAIKIQKNKENAEMILGIPDVPALHFVGKNAEGEAEMYEVMLIQEDEQWLEDYIHYDEPLVAVSLWSKDLLDDDDSMEGRPFVSKWSQDCKLSQRDYERLRELVLTYGKGEELKVKDMR